MILPFVHEQLSSNVPMAARTTPPPLRNGYTTTPLASDQAPNRSKRAKADAAPDSDHAAHLKQAINRITQRAFFEKREPRAKSFVDEAMSISAERSRLNMKKNGSGEVLGRPQAEYFTLKQDRVVVLRPDPCSSS